MHAIIREKLEKAKRDKDLDLIELLYEHNRCNLLITFEYARMLIEKDRIEDGKKIIISLLNTQIETLAMLELGKLEKEAGNIKEARKYFKDLLDTNNDPYAKLELGILEHEVGQPHLARKYFTSILKSKKDRSYALKLLVILEVSQNNYMKAFDYLKQALKEGVKINPNLIIHISKKLNLFFEFDYTQIKYNYSTRQLVDYDVEDSLRHIIERHASGIEGALNFNDNVDVIQLYNEIQNSLVKKNKIERLIFNDLYLIRKDNIGSNGENYLFVVTLPNSKEILTMYPIRSKKHINRYLESYDDNAEKVLKKVNSRVFN